MQQLKPVVDTLSVSAVVATLAGWLPHIAAAVSIVWGLIRIYETRTVQHLLGRHSRRSDDKRAGRNEAD